MSDVGPQLSRWVDAGLIDAETAARIHDFETGAIAPARWGWAARIALGFGALVFVAGVLLLVAAQWDRLSPGARLGLVLITVAGTHLAAAVATRRSGMLSPVLHGIGTALFGGAIFLTGQIFNLEAHWPAGVMLWALGAGVAWLLLRDAIQLAWVALLAPIWLSSEWMLAAESTGDEYHVAVLIGAGLLLLALAYLSAESPTATTAQRTLAALGTFLLLPGTFVLVIATRTAFVGHSEGLSVTVLAVGWAVAIGGPLCVAALFSGTRAWPLAVAAGWIAILTVLQRESVWPHLWWALGAAALAAWGVRDASQRRINHGFVIFAATVVIFYFSKIMTALAQSVSLIGLGVLLLAGGWALERARRRIVGAVAETKGSRR